MDLAEADADLEIEESLQCEPGQSHWTCAILDWRDAPECLALHLRECDPSKKGSCELLVTMAGERFADDQWIVSGEMTVLPRKSGTQNRRMLT